MSTQHRPHTETLTDPPDRVRCRPLGGPERVADVVAAELEADAAGPRILYRVEVDGAGYAVPAAETDPLDQ